MSPQTEGKVKSGACAPITGIVEWAVVGEGETGGVGLGFVVGSEVGVSTVGTGLVTPWSVGVWHP